MSDKFSLSLSIESMYLCWYIEKKISTVSACSPLTSSIQSLLQNCRYSEDKNRVECEHWNIFNTLLGSDPTQHLGGHHGHWAPDINIAE